MNLKIDSVDDFKKIIAHEPHYGSPILPYSQEEDFKKLDELFKNKKVGVIISGGNVDLDNLPWIKNDG